MNYTIKTIPAWLVNWSVAELGRLGTDVPHGSAVISAFCFCEEAFSGWDNEDIRDFVLTERNAARKSRSRDEVEQAIVDSYACGESPSMASVARRVGCAQSVVRRVVQQMVGDLPEVTGEDGRTYRFSPKKAIRAADRKMETTAKSQVQHVLRRAALAPASAAVGCAESVDSFRSSHARWRKQS